jgi:hypothetical protein
MVRSGCLPRQSGHRADFASAALFHQEPVLRRRRGGGSHRQPSSWRYNDRLAADGWQAHGEQLRRLPSNHGMAVMAELTYGTPVRWVGLTVGGAAGVR